MLLKQLQTIRIKFCDDLVHPVKEPEVLENLYGEAPLDTPSPPGQNTGAYVLSYVRKSRLEQLLPKVSIVDIPKNIGKAAIITYILAALSNHVIINYLSERFSLL